jgi:superoxide reductase
MGRIGELFQTADWTKEKHVPVIDCPDQVGADEFFDIAVAIGKEIAHPNTTEHHIRWIGLHFKPEGDKFAHELGLFTFAAHGESVDGPNKGPAYTNHSVVCRVKVNKPGTLYASAYCNIHGYWEFEKELKLR